MVGISLCVITKNEGLRLDNFISHHESLAEEIILLDTGSTDSTI